MDLLGLIHLTLLIRPDDFNFVPDPIWRQIYSTAVATGFDPLFDHLFTVYFEFNLAIERVDNGFFLIFQALIAVLIFIVWHVDMLLPFPKFKRPFRSSVHAGRGSTPPLQTGDFLTGISGIYFRRRL